MEVTLRNFYKAVDFPAVYRSTQDDPGGLKCRDIQSPLNNAKRWNIRKLKSQPKAYMTSCGEKSKIFYWFMNISKIL